MSEHRAVRRRVLVAEAAPGDHAAGLFRSAAQRRFLEGTADQLCLRHKHVEAGDDRKLHLLRDWLSLDFPGDQLLEHEAALAVADEDEGASIVLRREIIAPCRRNVAIGHRYCVADVTSRRIS